MILDLIAENPWCLKDERGILWLGGHLLYSFDCHLCSATHPTHGVNPCLHYGNDAKLSLQYSCILLNFKVQDDYYVSPSTVECQQRNCLQSKMSALNKQSYETRVTEIIIVSPQKPFIGFCLLLTVSNVGCRGILRLRDWDLQNLQVNTIFMAGNDCCLSSMWCYPRRNHTSERLIPVIAPSLIYTTCSFSFSELCRLLILKVALLFYCHTNITQEDEEGF